MADITYIPIRQLHPHPDNPRKELGDLSELAASIEENGVYQNLAWRLNAPWVSLSGILSPQRGHSGQPCS